MKTVEPLLRQCVNIILGNPSDKEEIRKIMVERKSRMPSPDDELDRDFTEWLAVNEVETFVKGVFKLNAAFFRWAEKHYMSAEDIFNPAASPGVPASS